MKKYNMNINSQYPMIPLFYCIKKTSASSYNGILTHVIDNHKPTYSHISTNSPISLCYIHIVRYLKIRYLYIYRTCDAFHVLK